LYELLKRPEISMNVIEEFLGNTNKIREVKLGVEADIKYSGFKENEMIEKNINNLKFY
jgi:hypothetical protein